MSTSEAVMTLKPEIDRFSMKRVSFLEAGEAFLSEWNAFTCRETPTQGEPMMHNPYWLRGYFDGQLQNLKVYSFYQSGSLCGIAPFLSKTWPLSCHLGVFTVAQLPIRRVR